jgi:hypothetical protein
MVGALMLRSACLSDAGSAEEAPAGFAYEPPEGWKSEVLKDETKATVFTHPAGRAALIVLSLPVSASVAMEQVPAAFEKVLREVQEMPLQLVRESRLDLAAGAVVQREYRVQEGEGESTPMLAAFIRQGSLAVMVGLTAPAEELAAFQAPFRRCVETVRVSGPGTTAPPRAIREEPPPDVAATLKALDAARQAGILPEAEYREKQATLGEGAQPTGSTARATASAAEAKVQPIRTTVSPAPVVPAAAVIRLKTHVCQDPLAKVEALRLLMPIDWRFEGGVHWSVDCTVMPVNAQFRVSNPAGTEEFEVFPNQVFFWDTQGPPPTLTGRYFGAEIRRPLDAQEALQQLVIPRYRGGNVQGEVRLIEVQSLPQLVQELPLEGQKAQAAKARIGYTRQGVPWEEEIYCVVEQYPVVTMPHRTFWFVEYTFSFKAQQGELTRSSKLLQTIAFSCKLNPHWLNQVAQVKEMLIAGQIQTIRNNAQLSDLLARTSSQMRQENLEQFNRRQQANDRIVDNFCQGIRGVARYHDPYKGYEVELPNGYPYVYANNLGEYILTESPSFNPGESSNLQWQQIQPRR